jgi:hypothetical protein
MHKLGSSKDTRYKVPLMGVLPQAASGSLLLVEVVPPPMEVSPLLLLLLQLPLLHGVDPLTDVSLPCLVGLDVLVQ